VAELGNLYQRMILECKKCHWRFEDDTVMEAILLHFQVDHDSSNIELALVPQCRCGTTMELVGNTKFSNASGDHIRSTWMCPACKSTGWLVQTDKEASGE
jgi:hypothetical protein